MKIKVVGLNHKSAPVAIRERLAFDSAKTIEALKQLKSRFPKTEFVLLSTCNRVELYTAGKGQAGLDTDTIAKFLSEFHDIALTDFSDFLYVHSNVDAAEHLLTVASSLDSMVVGEGQIIGQVKESYKLACTAESTGKILNNLFHRAFMTNKKVQTATSISSGRVSVAGVAAELASRLFADMSSAKVTVIGAGNTGELIIQHLLHLQCTNITIINRSSSRAKKIAASYGIKAGKWEQLDSEIIASDITIASAAVQDYLFKKDAFAKMTKKRCKAALLIIDIGVPRNFDPGIDKIEGVNLYSIDKLSAIADQNHKAREDDIAKGMRIVRENVGKFIDWFQTRDIGPSIGRMKDQFARISRKELDRFFVNGTQQIASREAAESIINRIVNKLLHCVIKNINTVAKERSPAEATKLVDSIVKQAEQISSESNEKVKVSS